ncbi:MAG: hypothetical protein NZM28_03845 [Fimbriimonadales bacterium]|nr:hypothetical protein [Fimbriimonadales bacterium]
MRKSWLIVVLIWLGFGSALAQRVEFPLDTYSYPEIARRLSVGGRTVTCDPALSQKLAVIGLKPREWGEVKALLEDALEIRIAPTDKERKRWRISRAPAVLQRERELRQRWAKAVEQRIREYRERSCAAMQKAINPSIPTDEVVQALGGSHRETPPQTNTSSYSTALYGRIARTLRSLKLDDILPYAHHIAKLSSDYWRYERETDYDPSKGDGSLSDFLSKHPLEGYYKNTPIESWLQRMESLPLSELSEWTGIKEDDLQNLSPEGLRFCILRELITALSWHYEGCLENEIALNCIPDVLQAIEQGYSTRVTKLKLPAHLARWTMPDYEPWHRLPHDALVELYAVSWLQSESSYYTMPIYLSPDPNFNCARPLVHGRVHGDIWNSNGDYAVWESRLKRMGDTGLLEQYRRALARHKELIRDKRFHQPLKRDGNRPQTLPLWMREWAQEHQQELIAEMFSLEEGRERFSTLAQVFEAYLEDRVYLLDRRGDVWIVRNLFAFANRAADYPLSALRDLARSRGLPEDWRRLWNATTPRQRQWLFLSRWDVFSLSQFRASWEADNFPSGSLSEALVFIPTLESLTEVDRLALLNAAPNTRVRVSLSYLPAPARQALQEWLSCKIRRYPELLLRLLSGGDELMGLLLDRMELQRTPVADLIGKAFHTAPDRAEELREQSLTSPPCWCLVYIDPCGKTHYLASTDRLWKESEE